MTWPEESGWPSTPVGTKARGRVSNLMLCSAINLRSIKTPGAPESSIAETVNGFLLTRRVHSRVAWILVRFSEFRVCRANEVVLGQLIGGVGDSR